MLQQDRYYSAPQRDPFLWERYEFAEGLVRLPALTLKVLFRPKVGLRRAEPSQFLLIAFLLIILNSFASMWEAWTSLPSFAHPLGSYVPHPHYLPMFALAVLVAGLWQNRNRWRELRANVFLWHTYSDGVSPFEIILYLLTPDALLKHRILLSPGWWLAEARIPRFVDPVVLFAVGYFVHGFDWILADWIMFAAFCLAAEESLIWGKALKVQLDMIDSRITADAMKQWSGATSGKRLSPDTRAAGRCTGAIVATGLGADIEKHLKARRNASRKERPALEPAWSSADVLRASDYVLEAPDNLAR